MKYTKEKILVGELPSGDALTFTQYTFTGAKKGPTVYIQGNIHGPEAIGIPVITELIAKLSQEKNIQGKIILVPTANPIGLGSKVGGYNVGYTNSRARIQPDWNSIFTYFTDEVLQKLPKAKDTKATLAFFEKAYKKKLHQQLEDSKESYKNIEQQLAYTIQSIAFGSDYILDIHTAQYNIEHIYSFGHSTDVAKSFGIPYIVELPSLTGCLEESMVMPFVALWKYLGKAYPSEDFPKHGFTLELTGSFFEKAYIDASVEKIWSFFQHIGSVSKKKLPTKEVKTYYYLPVTHLHTYFAPIGGILIPKKKLGSHFLKGEILAEVWNPQGKKMAIQAQHAGVIFKYPLSQIIPSGDEAVCIFIDPQKGNI